jgi:hypothetical protein
MKKFTSLLFLAVLLGGLVACSSNNSNDHNTGNGSYESPTNGNPPTDSTKTDPDKRDHTDVNKDTLHP